MLDIQTITKEIYCISNFHMRINIRPVTEKNTCIMQVAMPGMEDKKSMAYPCKLKQYSCFHTYVY